MAAKVLRTISEDELVRERILSIEKARQDQISREYSAKQEGKLEVAKALLLKGMDEIQIKEVTGLTDDDIAKIKAECSQD